MRISDGVKKILKFDINKLGLERKLWGGIAIVVFLCLINYCYLDIQMITRHSLNFLDVLIEGRLLQFYQTACKLPIGITNNITGEVPYDIWVYIPLAVWNLPIYLYEYFNGRTFEMNFFALLWARLGCLLPYIGCNFALCKIANEFKLEDNKKIRACLLFSSSLFLFNGLFCLGQIDIYSTFFVLMGIRGCLRNNKKDFLGWFAIAITYKMFALFVFLPLLLYKEKRIFYIIRDMAIAGSLTILSKLIFLFDKLQTPTKFDERRFIRFLLVRQIDMGEMVISIFVLLFLSLLVFCWVRNSGDNDSKSEIVCIAFGGYSAFFLGAMTFPYWAVVLAPFAALFYFIVPGNISTIVCLESIAGVAYYIKGMLDYGFVYGFESNIKWMLLGRLGGAPSEDFIVTKYYNGLSEGAQKNVQGILMGIFWVCIVAMIILVWKNKENNKHSQIGDSLSNRILWVRLFVNSSAILAPLLIYLFFCQF